MKRREVLAGASGLGVLVAAGVYYRGDSGAGAVEPVTVETLDAPGSDAGTVAVPRRGQVTVLEFFATWCDVCAASMPDAAEVEASLPGDVQFVSVTNEPVGQTVSRADVAAWWRRHDGAWTVGLDDDLALTGALDVAGVPMTVVLDADNVVRWQTAGAIDASEVLGQVEAARGGE